jgi:hypothetical protein
LHFFVQVGFFRVVKNVSRPWRLHQLPVVASAQRKQRHRGS